MGSHHSVAVVVWFWPELAPMQISIDIAKILEEQNKESQQRYNSRPSEMYRRPGDAVSGGEAAVKAARKFYALVSVDAAQSTGNSL